MDEVIIKIKFDKDDANARIESYGEERIETEEEWVVLWERVIDQMFQYRRQELYDDDTESDDAETAGVVFSYVKCKGSCSVFTVQLV